MFEKYKKIKILMLSIVCSSIVFTNTNAMKQQSTNSSSYLQSGYGTELKIKKLYESLNEIDTKYMVLIKNFGNISTYIPKAEDIKEILKNYIRLILIMDKIEDPEKNYKLYEDAFAIRSKFHELLKKLLINIRSQIYEEIKKYSLIITAGVERVFQNMIDEKSNKLYDISKNFIEMYNLCKDITMNFLEYDIFFYYNQELKGLCKNALSLGNWCTSNIIGLNAESLKIVNSILENINRGKIDRNINIKNVKEAVNVLEECYAKMTKVENYVFENRIKIKPGDGMNKGNTNEYDIFVQADNVRIGAESIISRVKKPENTLEKE